MHQSCVKCAEEHEQLAEWLEKLKWYEEKPDGYLANECELAGYRKGIDNFCEKIQWEYLNSCGIKQSEIEFLVSTSSQVAEQLKVGIENIDSNGWIPISERLPNPETYVLLSFENFSIPVIGRYEHDKGGGAFYAGDEDETLTSQDMYVNAWMPIPEPYKESEVIAEHRDNG